MTAPASSPRFRIFDAHFHVIDGRFPLVANQGYLPPEFPLAEYQAIARKVGIVGGALVSASYQGFDQTGPIAALEGLGPGFVGVLQIPASVSDEELVALDRAGVRAVRFNLKRGGSAGPDDLENMARRIYDLLGWHVELYIDAGKLDALFDRLVRLPKVSIDHLGLSKRGMRALLRLAGRGVQIKATGFARVDFDVAEALRNIAKTNPNCLMFGTDLPGTRAPRPFHESDIDLVIDAVGETLARKVFYDNAAAFYRVGESRC